MVPRDTLHCLASSKILRHDLPFASHVFKYGLSMLAFSANESPAYFYMCGHECWWKGRGAEYEAVKVNKIQVDVWVLISTWTQE